MACEDDGYRAWDPFSSAEAVAQEIVDLLLDEGGKRLYESYIEKKSFPYAAHAITDILVAELKMCYVRCDYGEPGAVQPESKIESETHDDGWALESEPPRCRIDTWARQCVPIKKKIVRPKNAITEDAKRKIRALKASTGSLSNGRSPSRSGVNTTSATVPEQHELARPLPTRAQMIPLVDEREPSKEDEEEAAMRDMKEREARRRKEEEARFQKKAAEEAEEAARLAQVKDQMKNKPFTYDSNGDVIWIQPPQVHKLPNANPAPTFTCSKEPPVHDEKSDRKNGRAGSNQRRGSLSRGPPKQPREKKEKDEGFVDSFRKFASQQPSMIEAMSLAPGVQLSENGATKRGEVRRTGNRGDPMTRKDYEAMSQSNAAPTAAYLDRGSDPSVVSGASPTKGPAATPDPNTAEGNELAQKIAATEEKTRGDTEAGGSKLKVVRVPDVGANLVPHPPDSPRPTQPVPPPTVRRVQMKRDALGYALSTRERVQTGTGSRFPGGGAQPVYGATMGHGLVPQGSKREEYYFPQGGSAAVGSGDSTGSVQAAGPNTVLQRPHHGQIVNRNTELVRRLFPR